MPPSNQVYQTQWDPPGRLSLHNTLPALLLLQSVRWHLVGRSRCFQCHVLGPRDAKELGENPHGCLCQRHRQENFPKVCSVSRSQHTPGHDEQRRKGEATEEPAITQTAIALTWGIKWSPLCSHRLSPSHFLIFIALLYRCVPWTSGNCVT